MSHLRFPSGSHLCTHVSLSVTCSLAVSVLVGLLAHAMLEELVLTTWGSPIRGTYGPEPGGGKVGEGGGEQDLGPSCDSPCCRNLARLSAARFLRTSCPSKCLLAQLACCPSSAIAGVEMGGAEGEDISAWQSCGSCGHVFT
jgi:hypothetical protein